LRGWEVWPTCEEFAIGGAKGLRDAVTRIRGPKWWAAELNLPGGERPPGGVRRWTDEVIRATLAEFFGRRSTWPTNREFDQAGLHGLREALRHYGGPVCWSTEMGVNWTPRAPSSRPRPRRIKSKRPAEPAREWPKWNDRTIAAELSTFLAGRVQWPRHAEFVESGRKGLYQAVLTHGGTHAWAERMGVQWVQRHGGTIPPWTVERVRERLTVFLDRRTVWPSPAEFAQAGERGLLAAARRLEGVDYWTNAFGLQPLPRSAGQRSRPRRQARSWDDARISAALGPLITELGRWPTKGEFRRAGLSKALGAVYAHGGSSLWQRRFGVIPRRLNGPVPDRRRWNAESVEAALRDFCQARATWPTCAEFQASGNQGLYRAAARYGGIHYWQARVALAPSIDSRAPTKARP
jgi:hypothetical protein